MNLIIVLLIISVIAFAIGFTFDKIYESYYFESGGQLCLFDYSNGMYCCGSIDLFKYRYGCMVFNCSIRRDHLIYYRIYLLLETGT